MPLLARGAAMRFLLTRAYDWLNRREDALVKPHDPPNICAGCASIRAHARSATTGVRRADDRAQA